MLKFVSVNGNELSGIASHKGFAEKWDLGYCLTLPEVKSVTYDHVTQSIINVWDDYSVTVIPVRFIEAIQDLSTGAWYYRT